jgi:hypothetical protein
VVNHTGTGKFSKVLAIWWLYTVYSKYTRALTFKVLWHTTLGQAPPPPPCPRCHAPRCFEAQVIPALLYLLICMYVCISYTHTHTHTRVCVCAYIYVYTYVCMYVCMYVCVCVCVCIYIYIYTSIYLAGWVYIYIYNMCR